MSATEVLAADPVASYAHRVGDDVHLVLQLPAGAMLPPSPVLRLRAGARNVRALATVTQVSTGTRLEALVPGRKLRPGVWGIVIPTGHHTGPMRLKARLMMSRKQPIALLTGPRTRPSVVIPTAKDIAHSGGQGRSLGIRRTAARVTDRALSRLPDARAARYRAVLSRAVKGALG